MDPFTLLIWLIVLLIFVALAFAIIRRMQVLSALVWVAYWLLPEFIRKRIPDRGW